MLAPFRTPEKGLNLDGIDDPVISRAFQSVQRILELMQQQLGKAINANALQKVDWNAAFSFTVPGDLAIAYSTNIASALYSDTLVIASFNIVTSLFTHTTSTGPGQITGLPFPIGAANRSSGSMYFSDITKAEYTQFLPYAISNVIRFSASGSASPGATDVLAADFPSGPQLILAGTIMYFRD